MIEIDGISHEGKEEYDTKREKHLIKMGMNVLRMDGYYVINHIEDALRRIEDMIVKIEEKTTP